MSIWEKNSGPHADIVISSRVRLARNYRQCPFPHWAKPAQRQELVAKVTGFVAENASCADLSFFDYQDSTLLDRQLLQEQHLVSVEHIKSTDQQGVFFNKTRNLSVMLNEEDQLRIQGFLPGLRLGDVWEQVDALDEVFAALSEYAYSSRWGYLTACPTNTGTGLRASTMLHLPALGVTRKIEKVIKAISQVGLVARGMQGEGTGSIGDFYQISNQITLGQSEEDLICNIEGVTKQIIGHEVDARRELLTDTPMKTSDQVWRAYGILKNVRIIGGYECLGLLSRLRLGVLLDILKFIPLETVNRLVVEIQPAHIQKMAGGAISAPERDLRRATLVREALPDQHKGA